MVTDYRIIIPSRGRTNKIKETIKLLPSATVVVNKEEYEAYKAVLPDTEIVTHELSGIVPIRQWILDTFKEKTIVMCDDDLVSLRCTVGQRQRFYTEPEVILQVIENSINITRDLNIPLFYWSRAGNPLSFKGCEPFSFGGGFAGGIFGVNGREYRIDQNLNTREDVDLTMQVLLKDRITYSDLRFYFNFGATWAGQGGNQGIRGLTEESDDEKYLKLKWRGCLDFGSTRNISVNAKKSVRNTTGTKNLVRRKNLIVV